MKIWVSYGFELIYNTNFKTSQNIFKTDIAFKGTLAAQLTIKNNKVINFLPGIGKSF